MRGDRLAGSRGLGPALRMGRVSALPPRAIAAPPQLGAVATGRLALQSGLLKGQSWLALAAAGQLAGHSAAAGALAPLPVHGPGEAAWLTMASLFTLAASFSGVIYYFARTTWEGLEPYIVSWPGARARLRGPVMVHGVDVSGSRFFARPVVLQAADFAAEAHSGQVRKTREPYVVHCIESALIVEGLLSPTEDDERAEAAVVAALLHDVLDDTDAEYAEIEAAFGEQVASMVASVSQLSTTNQIVRRRLRVESAQPTKEEEAQLRNMILTMVGEPLVIAIKLADRLHNMRTVYALSPEKQQAVAEETRRVWCSLAERLGMFALKSELEDLCFAVLQPTEYRALRRELDELWGVPSIPQQAVSESVECCLDEDCECVLDEGGHLSRMAASLAADPAAEHWADAAEALAERRASHAAASTRGGSSSSSSSSRGAAAAAEEGRDYSWLTPEQLETKALIDTVLPFDATTFNIAKLRSGAAGRRGLEVLQACAQLLMREIGTESLASGLEVSVQGRLKSLYSTFKKMARKQVPLKEVYDARALRVVVDDDGGRCQEEAIAACYKLLPAAHRLFRRVAGEEDDYIAQPKPSGYQSLHTAVVGPGGVPMEVQMRTSSMHAHAEYGKAAHWAYKEKPMTAAPTAPTAPSGAPSTPGPALAAAAAASAAGAGGAPGSTASSDDDSGYWLGIDVGHPMLHISPGGRLRDGVVVQSEYGGRRLLCAVSQRERGSPGASPAPADEYRRLAAYCEERGFFDASQGDMSASLELFTLCSDGKYHRLDRFGHKLPTVVVPLTLDAAAPALAAGAGGGADPEHGVGGVDSGAGTGEMDYMNNRIRLLRSMLEWGRELGSSIAAEQSGAGEASASDATAIAAWTEQQLALKPPACDQGTDVLVLVWPGGRILRVPRGTTAGAVIRDLGLIEIQPSTAVRSGDGAPAAPLAGASTSSGGGGGFGGRGSSRAVAGTTLAAPATPAALAAAAAAVPVVPVASRRPPAPPPGLLVNVNNRLVPEETPLFDGDYVVLSRDKVRI